MSCSALNHRDRGRCKAARSRSSHHHGHSSRVSCGTNANQNANADWGFGSQSRFVKRRTMRGRFGSCARLVFLRVERGSRRFAMLDSLELDAPLLEARIGPVCPFDTVTVVNDRRKAHRVRRGLSASRGALVPLQRQDQSFPIRLCLRRSRGSDANSKQTTTGS
jgi:hypothetical protein